MAGRGDGRTVGAAIRDVAEKGAGCAAPIAQRNIPRIQSLSAGIFLVGATLEVEYAVPASTGCQDLWRVALSPRLGKRKLCSTGQVGSNSAGVGSNREYRWFQHRFLSDFERPKKKPGLPQWSSLEPELNIRKQNGTSLGTKPEPTQKAGTYERDFPVGSKVPVSSLSSRVENL